MPKITTFMLCKDIIDMRRPNEAALTHLVAPKGLLSVQGLPAKISFGVSVGIVDISWANIKDISYEIYSPNGECLEKSPVLKIPEKYINASVSDIALNVKVENMYVPREGDYKFVLLINGECVGEKTFPVFQIHAETK